MKNYHNIEKLSRSHDYYVGYGANGQTYYIRRYGRKQWRAESRDPNISMEQFSAIKNNLDEMSAWLDSLGDNISIIPKTLHCQQIAKFDTQKTITVSTIGSLLQQTQFPTDICGTVVIDNDRGCEDNDNWTICHICYAINQLDGLALIVCLGKLNQGTVPVYTINYMWEPDYDNWQKYVIEKTKFVTDEFNRIVQTVKQLEKSRDPNVLIQGEQKGT